MVLREQILVPRSHIKVSACTGRRNCPSPMRTTDLRRRATRLTPDKRAQVTIVGAVYGLQPGKVDFLQSPPGASR